MVAAVQVIRSSPQSVFFFFSIRPGQSGMEATLWRSLLAPFPCSGAAASRRKCHCRCDVFKFLSALTVSTGASVVVFYRRLRAKFLLSLCAQKTLDAAEARARGEECLQWCPFTDANHAAIRQCRLFCRDQFPAFIAA